MRRFLCGSARKETTTFVLGSPLIKMGIRDYSVYVFVLPHTSVCFSDRVTVCVRLLGCGFSCEQKGNLEIGVPPLVASRIQE